jgi:hypothetical protein
MICSEEGATVGSIRGSPPRLDGDLGRVGLQVAAAIGRRRPLIEGSLNRQPYRSVEIARQVQGGRLKDADQRFARIVVISFPGPCRPGRPGFRLSVPDQAAQASWEADRS